MAYEGTSRFGNAGRKMAMYGPVSRRQFVLFQRRCNALAYERVLKCDKELNRMDVNAYSLFFPMRVPRYFRPFSILWKCIPSTSIGDTRFNTGARESIRRQQVQICPTDDQENLESRFYATYALPLKMLGVHS